jgi:hypothetical protein
VRGGFTSASSAARSMPGSETRSSSRRSLKAPALPAIGPIDTSDVIDTSAGSAIFWRAETAFIAPMKQAE